MQNSALPRFFRLASDSFIRTIGPYGYICSQLTKQDCVYDSVGQIFLSAISRTPQSLDAIVDRIASSFTGTTSRALQSDVAAFLETLLHDRYLVDGATARECAMNDTHFSYDCNPKTAFLHNAFPGSDETCLADTQQLLFEECVNNPHLICCQIEVTSCCNERCIHCYIPHHLKTRTLSFSNINHILEQLHEMGTLQLTLSGGEFFSHPDAARILQRARELDFSISVLSNATLLTSELIGILKDIHVNLVQISLYSTNPAEHDYITQVPGSCQKTKENLDALIAASVPVQISCPAMHSNFRSYRNVLHYAQERHCKAQTDFMLIACYDHSTANLDERLTLEEAETLIRDIIRHDPDYLPMTKRPVSSLSRAEWSLQPFCGVAVNSICIASDGLVYPCSGWQGMVCGDTKSQRISDIWDHSPQLVRLRGIKKSSLPQCYDCPDRLFCHPCLVRNFNENNGDILKVPKHCCQLTHLNRILVEEAKNANHAL